MKAWTVALIAAAGAFFFGLAMAVEVLVFLRMPEPPPGTSIGWDPVSFFHYAGLQFLVICASVAAATFAMVYLHFSRHPLPRN